jgi:hypothetical protein
MPARVEDVERTDAALIASLVGWERPRERAQMIFRASQAGCMTAAGTP